MEDREHIWPLSAYEDGEISWLMVENIVLVDTAGTAES